MAGCLGRTDNRLQKESRAVDIFAVKFDDLKRKMSTKGIVLNKLVTAQMGTPDYEAYTQLFCAKENSTIHMEMEDDHKTFTFYTIQNENPLNQTTAKTAPVEEGEPVTEPTGDDAPERQPSYTVVATHHDTEDSTVQVVKLSRKHMARLMTATPTSTMLQSEYVYFGSARMVDSDEQGEFTYEETSVSLTDEEGKFTPAFLYLTTRRMTLAEAMFAIGEV